MVIATHSGSFHADDVIGVALATILYPDAHVIRTREAAVLNSADMLIDVGGECEPERGRYDHHFQGAPARENGSIYSGAGLFWTREGPSVLRKIFPGLDWETARTRAAIVDRMFFEGMDRIDNGQDVKDAADKIVSETLARYNLTWNERPEEFSDVEGAISANFFLAVRLTRPVLVRMLGRIARSTGNLEARSHVAAARAELKEASRAREEKVKAAEQSAKSVLKEVIREASGPTLVLENPSLPWNDLIHEIEAESGAHFLHVVKRETSGVWVVTAVPVEKRSFIPRAMFPEEWAGLRDNDLERACGIKGASFCHPGRWISGWATLETALEAARIAQEGNKV